MRDRLVLAEELQTPGLVRGHELLEEKTAEQPPSGRHCVARPTPLLADLRAPKRVALVQRLDDGAKQINLRCCCPAAQILRPYYFG